MNYSVQGNNDDLDLTRESLYNYVIERENSDEVIENRKLSAYPRELEVPLVGYENIPFQKHSNKKRSYNLLLVVIIILILVAIGMFIYRKSKKNTLNVLSQNGNFNRSSLENLFRQSSSQVPIRRVFSSYQ